MKLTLRSLSLFFLLLWQFPLLAATFTIEVGDNFYRPAALTIQPGDVVTWKYVGQSSHPTASDNGAWATFPMNAANVAKSITFAAAGNFPYHCTAHGAPGLGQFGVITVSGITTATATARGVVPAFSVSPNPTRGLVTVSVAQLAVGHDYKLRLSNIIGREVRTVALRPEAADGGMSLNLSDLPAGMYFYSLLQNDRVVSTKRLLLQN
ncbi:T9SS type A sorting domain-containing protein [Hymenobacter rubripertinctus]|uniref:T9SS C-terminal target domain-containing protein n=1 Tax=Hymenobacter rubripertinctus TaxID=2029981 RepID=A0A418R2U8_9BACT|nr:T9SS type A sorting domain-containing protein [Hymenobacter rubripertinctus]RIY11745.1 T9SS C-terminal target domain-containing protein [Hymenobacter rubripertinctus]